MGRLWDIIVWDRSGTSPKLLETVMGRPWDMVGRLVWESSLIQVDSGHVWDVLGTCKTEFVIFQVGFPIANILVRPTIVNYLYCGSCQTLACMIKPQA